MPQENRAEWLAGSLRATVFPAEPVDLDSIAWWTDMVGEAPAKSTREPRKGVLEERGPYEGAELVLRVQPVRIDWILTPEGEAQGDSLPVVGSFSEMREPFKEFVIQWLASAGLPDVDRLAFAAVLLSPVSTLEEGYRQLNQYLPDVTIRVGECRGFGYQINRPRQSQCGIEPLKINRLNKWSVAQIEQRTLAISGERTQVARGQICTACRLEVDINTAVDYEGTLPRCNLADLFGELVALGSEIAEKGDIP